MPGAGRRELVPGVTTCGVGRLRAPARTSWDRGRGASIKSPRSPRRIATRRRPGAPRPDALATGGESVSLSDKRLTPYVAIRTCARVAAILTRAPEVCGTAPFWRRSAG